MATKQIVNNQTVATVDTVTTMYSAPENQSVVIESFTASNTSNVNASYAAYIQGLTGDLQPQIPYKIVVWGENDLGIGLVGQVIPAGGFLKVECSALDSIYFTVTGREV